MIFFISIIFVNYILSFSLVGLWTIQVHSIGYSIRSCAKDMTITIGIINPRKKIGLECKWRHARNRWSWEFEDFEKESVGSWLWPCRQTAGLSAIETDSWSWGPTMMLRNWDWTTRCTERWGVVSIIRLRKNYLSSRVEEPKSEINKRFVPEQRGRLCIYIVWFAYVYA